MVALSDEFDGSEVDSKWIIESEENSDLKWPGRPPALFQKESFKIDDGELTIEVGKLPEPVTRSPYGKPVTYTYYGGRLCSKLTSSIGHYYECRMKMNKTEMGGGFWLENSSSVCNKRHEIDIIEFVGHTTEQTDAWAKNWD